MNPTDEFEALADTGDSVPFTPPAQMTTSLPADILTDPPAGKANGWRELLKRINSLGTPRNQADRAALYKRKEEVISKIQLLENGPSAPEINADTEAVD